MEIHSGKVEANTCSLLILKIAWSAKRSQEVIIDANDRDCYKDISLFQRPTEVFVQKKHFLIGFYLLQYLVR